MPKRNQGLNDVAPVDLAGRHCGTRAAKDEAAHGNGGGTTFSLNVLPTKPKVKKSKMGWKRAAVLVGVHVVMIVHAIQWYVSGMSNGGSPRTVSPIEPSESMAALELGEVNAGFVLFVGAIVSTFLFGRFFCGWGCHIVALQDFCGWLMKKMGVHPKPFRTRLLLIMPLLMGGYMFVWPTFKRELLKPAITSIWGADTYEHLSPFIGDAVPRPIFKPNFIVEDFWATFPPLEIAVPFLLICGFATVYFLGAKGFCTYGCPYAGFFVPADKVSIGKIVVNDNCEQCGHCTAVCTSNVRVHEEVRDYGMVVDPGCMKCLDCVSVCPNEALSFGFAKPAVLAKARTPEAKERRKKHVVPYDLTIAEEVWVGLTFFVFTWFGFRGMLNSVPLLMSAGLGAIAAFTTWKLVRLFRTDNVRLGHLQLRIKKRFTAWGVVFVPLAAALFALGVWGTTVRMSREVGGFWDYWVREGNAFAANYVPEAEEKAKALKAIANLKRGDAIGEGGIGWSLKTPEVSRLAWLYAVAGDKDNCVRMQERVVKLIREDVASSSLRGTRRTRNAGLAEAILRLADFYLYRGDSPQSVEAFLLKEAVDEEGLGLVAIRVGYNVFRATNNAAEAEKLVRKGVALNRGSEFAHAAALSQAAQVLGAMNRAALARPLFEEEIKLADEALDQRKGLDKYYGRGRMSHLYPHDELRLAFGHFLAASNAPESAKEQFGLVSAEHPLVTQAWLGEAQVLLTQNRPERAVKALETALTHRPRSAELVSMYARALHAAGRSSDALKQLERWTQLDPRDQTPWLSLAELERLVHGDKAALEVYLRAEKHRGDDPVMLMVAAEALLKAKRNAEAIEFLRRGVDLPPKSPAFRARAKELLMGAGLTKEAESF